MEVCTHCSMCLNPKSLRYSEKSAKLLLDAAGTLPPSPGDALQAVDSITSCSRFSPILAGLLKEQVEGWLPSPG